MLAVDVMEDMAAAPSSLSLSVMYEVKKGVGWKRHYGETDAIYTASRTFSFLPATTRSRTHLPYGTASPMASSARWVYLKCPSCRIEPVCGACRDTTPVAYGISRSTTHTCSPDRCTLVGRRPGDPHDSARPARARLPVCLSLWITRGIRGERRVTTADVCSFWRHYCSTRQPARIGAAESACGRGSGNEARQPTRTDV